MDDGYGYDDDYGGRVLWGRVAFYLGSLLVVFLLGRCSAGGADPAQLAEAQDTIQTLSEENERLEQELAALRGVANAPTNPDATSSPGATEAATESDAGTRTYVVQSGDTLRKIAEQFYGDDEKYALIAEANGLDEQNRLKVGQELRIPPAEG